MFEVDLVRQRLLSLGYTNQNIEDEFVLTYCIEKVCSTIKNKTNQNDIVDGLMYIAIDMICGEFLYFKKQTGTLTGFDLEVAVKQVQLGDTNVVFAVEKSASVEQRLDALFTYLINKGEGEFACYRKIKW